MAKKERLEVYFKVVNGEFVPVNREMAAMVRQRIKDWEGKTFKAVYERHSLKASSAQFHYKTVQEFLVEHGTPEDEATLENIDHSFKMMFSSEESVDLLTGNITKRIKEKKTFSTSEMSQFINDITRYCATELELPLRSSEEYLAEMGITES
jgi:hypothetical protein